MPRIDVYLYPSVEAKRAVTDNAELAHAVEWASVVHLAWVDGGERAFMGEAAKVSAAASLGRMYNPFIRDGIGVAARGTWDGQPLRGAAAHIAESDKTITLASLLDPIEYRRLGVGIGQPLAGSFIEYTVATRGAEGVAALCREYGAGAGPSGEEAETVFGVPVHDIDAQWKDYLRAEKLSGAEQP